MSEDAYDVAIKPFDVTGEGRTEKFVHNKDFFVRQSKDGTIDPVWLNKGEEKLKSLGLAGSALPTVAEISGRGQLKTSALPPASTQAATSRPAESGFVGTMSPAQAEAVAAAIIAHSQTERSVSRTTTSALMPTSKAYTPDELAARINGSRSCNAFFDAAFAKHGWGEIIERINRTPSTGSISSGPLSPQEVAALINAETRA